MNSSNKRSGGQVISYTAIGIGVFATIAVILFSGFSLGTLNETPSNPFGPGEGPPKIVLINNGTKYEGQLLGYTFSKRFESLQELPDISTGNITAISAENVVPVGRGSQIQFVIEGNPPTESQFDSLSVTAYTEDGRPAGGSVALNNNNNSTENVLRYPLEKLQSGRQYILVSTATWLDYKDSPEITGYVYYGHRVST